MSDLLHILTTNSPHTHSTHLTEDIRRHLLYLLNSQRESTAHLPYYGLPDLSYLRTNLPYSEESILENLRETLKHYEPRLKNIRVKKEISEGVEFSFLRIKIEAIGHKGELLEYGGYLSATGELSIE